jgi:hypothetical protein
MVGPSITADDRKRFLVQLKIGFALLVGMSMALVTLYSGASLLAVAAVALGTTLLGGLLAEFTFPDSMGETPYKDSLDRGPKPGTRTQERREQSETEHRADGDGRRQR